MADKDIGLRESARLFAEAMAERYFKNEDTDNALLLVVKENDGVSSAIVGYDKDLVQALVSAMKDPNINKVVNTAFMLKDGRELINHAFNNLQQ